MIASTPNNPRNVLRELTVITVCKNSFEGLSSSMSYLRRAKVLGAQLLFYDAQSTDGSYEFAMQSGIFNILIQRSDSGVYSGMNYASKHCRTSYLVFSNCGDYLFADNIAKVFSSLLACNSDLLYGDLLIRNPRSGIDERVSPKTRPSPYSMPAFHPSCIYKTSLMLDNPFNETFRVASDFKQIRDIFSSDARLLYQPVPFAVFFPGGLSSSKRTRFIECSQIILSDSQHSILVRYLHTAIYAFKLIIYDIIKFLR